MRKASFCRAIRHIAILPYTLFNPFELLFFYSTNTARNIDVLPDKSLELYGFNIITEEQKGMFYEKEVITFMRSYASCFLEHKIVQPVFRFFSATVHHLMFWNMDF
ncbi:hypothetical protein M1D52_02235 [Olivibacter sp. SA151]|uniref:hypothetical protein n=1 Tax=Olivibacter jilunii TaxID=985016 RepID=UPI003F15545F